MYAVMNWLREYGLACMCLVVTYVLFLCAAGMSWWVAGIATVFTWACALGLCYLASPIHD